MAEDLIITLGLKDQGAKQQLTGLNKELRMLDKEFKATNKGSASFEQGTSKLSKQLGILENKYKANEAKVKAYKKVIEDTQKALDKKKQELEKLTNAENVNEKAVEKCKSQIANMEQTLNKTAREINLTEQEMKELAGQIKATQSAIDNKPYDDARAKLNQLGDEAIKAGEKLKSAGEAMNNAGNTLLKLSAPIIAFGAYAVKATMDFEQGMAKVQAISGATGAELEQLKAKAKEMGEKTKFSATESAEALSYMAMAGWKTNQMLGGLEGIMNLAAASGESLALVSDIVTDAMTAFGMEAKEAGRFSDILASASSNANTNVAMMGETFKYVAPIAGAMRYTAEDTAVAIGLMANSGIKASQAGTSLRQILMGLQGGVELVMGKTKKYHVEVENMDGTMRKFSDVLGDLRDGFSLMTDAQKAQNAESIAGKVGMSGLLAIVNASEADFRKLTDAVENSNGKSKEMADIMNNTAKGQLTLLNSKLESLGIQIGERLLPHVNNFIEGLSKVIGFFADLSPATQDMIMQFGLFTAGTGLALKGVGLLTKGLGSLVSSGGSAIKFMAKYTKETSLLNKASKVASGTTGVKGVVGAMKLLAPVALPAVAGITALGVGIAGVKTHSDLMKKSVATSREELKTFEKVVASLTGTQFKSREELEKLGLVYKKFGDNISEEFQDSVKSSQKTLMDFNASLHEISFDKKISKEESKAFNESVKEMCSSAIKIIKEKQKETNEEMSKMFKMDDGKIDKQEQQVLKILQKSSQNQVTEIQKLEKEIYAIKDKAIKAKRELNEKEIADIQTKTTRIKELELQALGSSQEEIIFAKKEFSARVANADLESTSALMVEKAKKRDEEIIQIQASYDTQLEMLRIQAETATGKEKEAIEAQILRHTEARDKKIEGENLLFNELLRIAGEKNPELLEQINMFNGEVLTKADQKKAEELRIFGEQWEGIDKIQSDGSYRLKNKTSDTYRDVIAITDKSTGKVIGLYDTQTKEAFAYSEDIATAVKNTAKEHDSATSLMAKVFSSSSKSMVDSSGKIIDSNGKTVGSLKEVEKQTDGTYKSIVNINGEDIEITVNKDGTLKDINSIKSAINSIPPSKTVNINVNKNEKTTRTVENVPSGKSIPAPQMGGFALSEVPTTSFSLPKINYSVPDVSNVITDPSYYSKANPVLNSVVNNNYHNSKSIQNNTNSSQGLNLDGLGDVIASAVATAVAEALKNVKLEPKFVATIDNRELTTTVSQDMGMNTKRRR